MWLMKADIYLVRGLVGLWPQLASLVLQPSGWSQRQPVSGGRRTQTYPGPIRPVVFCFTQTADL